MPVASLLFSLFQEIFDIQPDYVNECVYDDVIYILYKHVSCEAVYKNTRNSKWRAIMWMPYAATCETQNLNIPQTWFRQEYDSGVEFGTWCDKITNNWIDEHDDGDDSEDDSEKSVVERRVLKKVKLCIYCDDDDGFLDTLCGMCDNDEFTLEEMFSEIDRDEDYAAYHYDYERSDIKEEVDDDRQKWFYNGKVRDVKHTFLDVMAARQYE